MKITKVLLSERTIGIQDALRHCNISIKAFDEYYHLVRLDQGFGFAVWDSLPIYVTDSREETLKEALEGGEEVFVWDE